MMPTYGFQNTFEGVNIVKHDGQLDVILMRDVKDTQLANVLVDLLNRQEQLEAQLAKHNAALNQTANCLSCMDRHFYYKIIREL